MAPTFTNCSNPVAMIPGLSTQKKLKQAGKLLRRPLAPKILPPLMSREQENESSKEYSGADSMIKMFQGSFNLDALKSNYGDADFGTEEGSADPSLVCPPPTSASGEKDCPHIFVKTPKLIKTNILHLHPSPESTSFLINCDDMRYILDSAHKDRTSPGVLIPGKSLVRSHRHRGPDPLPVRTPKKIPESFPFYDVNDERYEQPPSFIFEQFVYKSADNGNVSMPEVGNTVYSRHNVRKLTDLLAKELNRGGQESVHTHNFDTSRIPLKENRIPHRQLLYEMTALMKEYVQEKTGKNVKSFIKFSPKCSTVFSSGHHSESEILLFEDDSAQRASAAARSRQETEMPGVDAVLTSAYSRYFQGSQRSRSPLCQVQDETISPSEMAVMDSLITGGTTLNFCAHFIEKLPDISPLRNMLTHLNLCFNNFQNFPVEVLDLKNLEVLQMRNNPLVEISADINLLQKLRVLVVSFCLVTALPKSLFDLPSLEELSLAYNHLTFIPEDISHLQSLKLLDVEGNQIPALPASCVTMNKLSHVNVRNNFMHPLFWQENTKNKPQSLLDLACVCVSRTKHQRDLQNVSTEVTEILARQEVCNICKGPLFGPGLRMIRPMSQLFSVKHMPLLFRACTPKCLHHFQNMSPESLRILLYGE